MRSRDQSQFAFEYLDWSWLPSKNVQRAAKWFACLILGLVLGLVFAPVLRLGGGLLIGLGRGLVEGLSMAALFLLVLGLKFALVPRPLREYSAPNRATLRSLHHALIVMLILVSGILVAALSVPARYLRP